MTARDDAVFGAKLAEQARKPDPARERCSKGPLA